MTKGEEAAAAAITKTTTAIAPNCEDALHGPVMIISTYPDREAASRAVLRIVESRLAACANVLEVSSFYWWDEKVVADEREQLVIFKTAPHRKEELKDMIRDTHPYDVPEIAEVAVRDINGPYMEWLASSTGGAPP